MRWRRRARPQVKSSHLTAFVDEGSEIEGRYAFRGTVMLNGKFSGEIETPDTLIVGERGSVHANIRAGTVLVNGEVVGDIVASDRLELRGHARVVGDVETPVLVVEEGVVLEGRCRMQREAPAEAAPPARDLTVVTGRR
jgi:cytoskeletal protein CcmA (bactofilin family)